jgi:DNA repair exonuclease SbcCD ATPase subunit
MFDLQSIIISNFRSYYGKHEFTFPKKPGLYYLTGLNVAEPALGANGAGKSTLLDAITWVLFGHTTRGLKANEVLSWDSTTGAAVTLDLLVGKNALCVQRTQKPNGLFLNGKPVDQTELQTHIRLNYDSFMYSIINAQFGQSFFSLKPSAKLTLFSDIMTLDYWLKCSDEALKIARDQESVLSELKDEISNKEGKIEVLLDDVEQLIKDEAAFNDTREAEVVDLRNEVSNVYKRMNSLRGKFDNLNDEKRKITKQYRLLKEKVGASKSKLDDLLGYLSEIAKQRNKFTFEKNLVDDRKKVIGLMKGTCPTCIQKINESYRKHLLAVDMNRLAQLEISFKNNGNASAGIQQEIVKCKLGLESETSDLSKLQAEIHDLTTQQATTKERIVAEGFKQDDLSVQLRKLSQEKNPFTEMRKTKKTKTAELRKKVAEAKADMQALEADFHATKYWVKGFKRVRLFIIEQAFKTLEIEVNNSLAQLGMLNWQITFDIERENKTGGITKGFVVFVKGPANAEPVRWENWSGGETQRLQLAGDLGLANLIMQQNGLTSTIEFYDEPSTHLSPEGMIDLANMLHDRAVNEGKRVWIVDHASITNFGEFEGIITARKDENGSTIAIST